MTSEDWISGWQNKEGPVDIMVIGLAPSVHGAAINKKPLSESRSGKLLWKIFKEAKINEKTIYITNLVKFALPNNRPPNKYEINKCRNALNREWKDKKPKYVLLLGAQVAKEFNLKLYHEKNKFIAIPHPAYFLRANKNPQECVLYLQALLNRKI